ncbi:hypothetical protein [Sphingomonas bacterium]|uniref:hypothetical protein n=1 Tax=Sphingomonas bacterium TaxID=1895847 RepID=UPI001576C961|nr:hypothetical protein [Sphingomonas bacterium]
MTSTVLLGDNYLLWVSAIGAAPPVYAVIQGQGTATINRSQNKIATSSKTTQGYGTNAYGLIDLTIDLDILPTLPDPTGYTQFETNCNAVPRTPFAIEIRKNGLAGVEADAIFSAVMYGSITSTALTQAEKVQCKAQLALAAAPTVDALK